MNSSANKTEAWQDLYALCHPLCREAYQPGHRDTFVSGSDSGFLLMDGDRMIVAIAGSDDVMDWFDRRAGNLHVEPVPVMQGLAVHAGMLAAATAIADTIASDIRDFLKNPAARLLLTGHSRGGAIAQILPFVLGVQTRCQVVTFGSPKVLAGDVSLDAVHFQNWSDLVHRLPVVAASRQPFRFTGRIVRKTNWGTVCESEAQHTAWRHQLRRMLPVAAGIGVAFVRRQLLPMSLVTKTIRMIADAHSLDGGYAMERWCRDEA